MIGDGDEGEGGGCAAEERWRSEHSAAVGRSYRRGGVGEGT